MSHHLDRARAAQEKARIAALRAQCASDRAQRAEAAAQGAAGRAHQLTAASVHEQTALHGDDPLSAAAREAQ